MKRRETNVTKMKKEELRAVPHQDTRPRPYSFFLGLFLVSFGVASLASTSFATNSAYSSTTIENFNYKYPDGIFKNYERLHEPSKDEGASSSSSPGSRGVHHNIRHHHRAATTLISNGATAKLTQKSDNDTGAPDDPIKSPPQERRLIPKITLNFTWPIRESASLVDGNITIGALHMIHERSEDFGCGRIMDQGGIQALEVMLYTLDHINGKYGPMLIPGVHLGVLAKDDCDTDIYGLEQALDFIRGSITNIGGSSYKCKDGLPPENKVKVISGVIGAPSSQTSIQVANLLKLFKIPQVRN